MIQQFYTFTHLKRRPNDEYDRYSKNFKNFIFMASLLIIIKNIGLI